MSFQAAKEAIESLRTELVEVKKPIEVMDYGAGPDGKRSKAEMEQGVCAAKTTEICRTGLKEKWAEAIYNLVQQKQPAMVLELGTCCGFSAAYMSKAAPQASITTIEGAPALAEIARENLKQLACKNVKVVEGRFDNVLSTVLSGMEGVDIAFIDGHHDRDATIEYYHQILPYLNRNGVMVFDDIAWSEGMREAWRFIEQDADTVKSVTTEKLGILYFGENFKYFQTE